MNIVTPEYILKNTEIFLEKIENLIRTTTYASTSIYFFRSNIPGRIVISSVFLSPSATDITSASTEVTDTYKNERFLLNVVTHFSKNLETQDMIYLKIKLACKTCDLFQLTKQKITLIDSLE